MKIGFFGSPAVSARLLRALLESKHEVVCVVSNPDRPRGRSKRPHPSEVSAFALEHGLPLYRWDSLKKEGRANPAIVSGLAGHGAELFLVFAYGKIIPKEIFALPSKGSINLHGSLLPLLRGASPIQSALWQGLEKTGWSVQVLSERMDAGAVLAQREIRIDPNETAGELTERMLPLGIELVFDVLENFSEYFSSARPQEESRATYCKKIQTEDAWIDWNLTAQSTHNQIRALNPSPGARSLLSDVPVKIWRSRILERTPDAWKKAPPGTFGRHPENKAMLAVRTQDACLEILELQPQGRKRLTARDFLNGYRKEGPILLQKP